MEAWEQFRKLKEPFTEYPLSIPLPPITQKCRTRFEADKISYLISIGNKDVIYLLETLMALNNGSDTLPAITEGYMTCQQGKTHADVEWKVYSSQAAA